MTHTDALGPRLGFDLFRDATVDPGAPARRQVLVQRVLHERVSERVLVGPDVVHQRGRDGAVEDVEHGVFVRVRDGGEQAEPEVPADHRRGAQRSLGLRAEARNTFADHLAHAHRQSRRDDLVRGPAPLGPFGDRSGFEEMAHDLRGEERVAVGLGGDRVAQRRRVVADVRSGELAHQVQQLEIVEAAQFDELDPARVAAERTLRSERVRRRDRQVGTHRRRATASAPRRRARDAAVGRWPCRPSAGRRARRRSAGGPRSASGGRSRLRTAHSARPPRRTPRAPARRCGPRAPGPAERAGRRGWRRARRSCDPAPRR